MINFHFRRFARSRRELDLASNSIRGPITRNTIPALRFLELLNLDRNLLTSIYTGALHNFPFLITLSLRHNQIDVLQDHAFAGLSSLQMLDLSYNGIVAVSEASLQHLSRLTVLNLTHNFLRALTSDLIAPLPALKDLQLDGNDISIVERNALDTAEHLHSLSLRDNPLSCDCSMKPFAEWMLASKIPTRDLVGAVCATPPHLEGAPLFQIKPDALNCDGNLNKYDNANVLRQLATIASHSNVSYEKEFSNAVSDSLFYPLESIDRLLSGILLSDNPERFPSVGRLWTDPDVGGQHECPSIRLRCDFHLSRDRTGRNANEELAIQGN